MRYKQLDKQEVKSPPAPPLSGGETLVVSAEGAVVSPPDKGGPGGDSDFHATDPPARRFAIRFILLISFSFFLFTLAFGQSLSIDSTKTKKPPFYKRIIDGKARDTSKCWAVRTFGHSWVAMPFLSYAPETRLLGGLNARYIFRLDKHDSLTRTSQVSFLAAYTLNNQSILQGNTRIFFPKENYILNARLRYLKFPQKFWGLGPTSPDSVEERYSFQTVEAEAVVLRRIYHKWFGGAGYRFVDIFDMETQKGGFLEANQPVGWQGAISSGLIVSTMFDSRDNIFGSRRGILVEFNAQFNEKWLGSANRFQLYTVDLRYFFQPFKKRRDVLAFQLYGQGSVGDIPFGQLAQLGGGKILRGYYQGRYVDRFYWAAQAEYRLSLNKWLGFAAFFSVGDVAPNIASFQFNTLKYAGGGGARLKILRKENAHIRIDYAISPEGGNFYFNIFEAF